MGTALDALVRELAEPLAEELGLGLYDVQVVRGRRLVIRLSADRRVKQGPTDGITIAECTTLSRRLEHLLDLEEAVPERYALEVSSPGLERKLRSRSHFEGAVGEWVRVQVHGAEGVETLEGKLASIEGERIVLEGETSTQELALSEVRRAETIYRG